tara:strand:+ start:807 stop:1103 length:297 start_codon:yes stop_codon:yes gene_type:complete
MPIKNDPPNEKESIRERLAQHFGDDLLFADNFDAAIIGVSIGCDSGRVVYSTKKMAEVLMQDDNMSYQEAWEYLEFNTFSAYVGENTPIYVEELDDEY